MLEGLACQGRRGTRSVFVLLLGRDLGKGCAEERFAGFQLLATLQKYKLLVEATVNPSPTCDTSKGAFITFKTLLTYQVLMLVESLSQMDKTVDKDDFFSAYGRRLPNASPHLSKVH